jgi:hypothetical protein
LLALALLLAAGCLSASTPPAPPPLDVDRAALLPVGAPIVQDHDHADPALHVGSANIAAVGYHSGYGDGTAAALPEGQGFSEMAVWEGERDGANRTLAFVGRRGGPDGGFVVIDATDPTAMQRLGAFPGLGNYDIEISADGAFAFSTTQWLPTEQDPAQLEPAEDQRGVYIVDLADLASPALAGFFPVPTRGAHTLSHFAMADGRELVILNTYDFVPDPSLRVPIPGLGGNPVAHRVLITQFVRAPSPHLELLSVFQKTEEVAPQGKAYFPHDTFVQVHPVTGALILYVAYWDLGAYLVDISDPTMPRELSRLTDFSPSKHASIHLARPAPALIDGVHVTITEPELGATDETGQLTLYDTTDPAAPKRLGYWTLPGDLAITEGLIFSPHNFDIANGRVYLAHYHAGVWVIDVHNASLLQRPEEIGYYQTAIPRPSFAGYATNFWSAFYHDGLIYASDISAGLQVLRFRLDAPS